MDLRSNENIVGYRSRLHNQINDKNVFVAITIFGSFTFIFIFLKTYEIRTFSEICWSPAHFSFLPHLENAL